MGIGGKKKVFLLPPSHITQRHRKPSGYNMTHQSCQTGQTGQTGLTQAPRSRAPQTAVAIKQAYPTGISAAAPNQTAACKPTGYTMAHQSLSYRSYRSYKSYASATPTQHANRRCHQKSQHTPTVNLPPLSHTSLKGVIFGCQKVLQDIPSATYPAEPDENV